MQVFHEEKKVRKKILATRRTKDLLDSMILRRGLSYHGFVSQTMPSNGNYWLANGWQARSIIISSLVYMLLDPNMTSYVTHSICNLFDP